MTAVVTLVAALISCAGTVLAAVITTRQRGPAGTAVLRTASGHAMTVDDARVSKSFWLGLAGLILWILPLLGYLVILPGLYIGIREVNGPRRRTAAGLAMCVIALGLALINSAVGAYQGAHGQLWFQQGQ